MRWVRSTGEWVLKAKMSPVECTVCSLSLSFKGKNSIKTGLEQSVLKWQEFIKHSGSTLSSRAESGLSGNQKQPCW